MEAKLLLIPWMMAVIYSSVPLFWFVIHPVATRWRRMRRSPYRALLPLWFLMIAGLAWLTWPLHSQRIYSTLWMWLPSLPLFAIGLRVYSRIFSEFGGHKLSGEAELRPAEHEQQLVTTGLHASMRHPIYFAHLCNLLGWTIGSGLLVNFLLLALNLFVTFPIMIAMEEHELQERFGQSYSEYKKRVSLLPLPRAKSSGLSRHQGTAERA